MLDNQFKFVLFTTETILKQAGLFLIYICLWTFWGPWINVVPIWFEIRHGGKILSVISFVFRCFLEVEITPIYVFIFVFCVIYYLIYIFFNF
jgi:hypothetical protein